ncbi:uncharacterized protein [Dermacentor andersoni]|uniref:uncharacterized protein isoform X1 n=2 Tax=Dermacentor andersoni TaxID=34620 RepID=UPI0024167A20|nr:uncharacterized protein LOC126536959 isoform X1 [Dermacentor andersoni]
MHLMGSRTVAALVILLLFEHGKCDLCDICRRKRDSAVRMPYNQRWHFDASSFLCQPFNFCDDEITERMKGRKSKAEINCGGVDCFEWLYESLKKRQAQESDLPKTMLSHHQYHAPHATTTAPLAPKPVFTAATRHGEATTTQLTSTVTVGTIVKEPATSQDEALNEPEAPYEFGLAKPEAIHVPLVPKHSSHRKPELCTLKPDRGRRWPCSQRWYYNTEENACSTFTFCGQKGNRNNFLTNETCYEECHDGSHRT